MELSARQSHALTSEGPEVKSKATGGLRAQRVRRAWLVTLPMLVVLLMVAGWPLGRTIWFSLSDAELAQLDSRHFVGLDNYIGPDGLLWSGDWWHSVGNTVVFAVLSVVLETLLGLGVALLLNQPSRIRTLLRAAMLVPWAIPTVVSAKMWSWMLHDQFGIVNHYLLALGMLSAPLAWTADPSLSLFTIVLVDVWKATPYMALLILAALQMVPVDCYEAAKVDGVPAWTVFRRVTLPLIMPGVLVAMVFRMLDALRVFDVIYVMTSNSRATKVGYGSAAATMLFFLIALITIACMGLMRRSSDKVAA